MTCYCCGRECAEGEERHRWGITFEADSVTPKSSYCPACWRNRQDTTKLTSAELNHLLTLIEAGYLLKREEYLVLVAEMRRNWQTRCEARKAARELFTATYRNEYERAQWIEKYSWLLPRERSMGSDEITVRDDFNDPYPEH